MIAIREQYGFITIFSMHGNALFRGCFTEVCFASYYETSCHIFKMATFSKFFGDLMKYIMREYAGKKENYF